MLASPVDVGVRSNVIIAAWSVLVTASPPPPPPPAAPPAPSPRRALHGHKSRANRMLSAPLSRCVYASVCGCLCVWLSECVCVCVSLYEWAYTHASGVHNLAAIALILIIHWEKCMETTSAKFACRFNGNKYRYCICKNNKCKTSCVNLILIDDKLVFD